MNGVVDKWVDEWITGQRSGCMDYYMNGKMDGYWTNERLAASENQAQEWLKQEWLLTRT